MIDQNDPRLTAYLLGELDAEQTAEIESAINQSDELQRHVSELRSTIEILHQAAQPAGEETPTMTADQLKAIESALNPESADNSESDAEVTQLPRIQTTDSPSRFRWQNLAIATLVLYAVGLSLFAFQRPPTPVAKSAIEIQGSVAEESIPDVSFDETTFDAERMDEDEIIDKSADLMNRVNVQRAATEGRLRADVKAALRANERLIRSDPTGVAGSLKSTLDRVESTPNISSELRLDLVTQLQSAIQVASAAEARYIENLSPAEATQRANNSTSPLFAETGASGMLDRVQQERQRGGDRINAEVRPSIRSADSVETPAGVQEVADGNNTSSRSIQINRQWTEAMPPPKLPSASRAGQPAPTTDPSDPFGDGSVTIGWDGVQGLPSASFDELFGGTTNAQDDEQRGVVAAVPARSPNEEYPLSNLEPADPMANSKRRPRRRPGFSGGMGGMDMEMGGFAPGSADDEMMGMDDMGMGDMMMSMDGGMVEGDTGVDRATSRRFREQYGANSDAEMAEFGFGDIAESVADPSSDMMGEVNIQFVPELGQIIVTGNSNDVERVKKTIDELEARSDLDEDERNELTTKLAEKSGGDSNKDAIDALRKKMQTRLGSSTKTNPTPKTWKPASAATNRARLSVGHHDDLQLTARDTYVRIDGFRARVFFDCYYFNDRWQQLEGQFMLRLPNDASLHYFAFGPTNLSVPRDPASPPNGKPGAQPTPQLTAAQHSINVLRAQLAANGSDLARRAADNQFKPEPNSTFGLVKPALVAPRQKAAFAYDETVRRRVDPALVEWAGPGIFQTRVFPLMPGKLHRIIVGYDVSLVDDGDDRLFKLDLPEGEAGGRVEFDVAATAGTQAVIDPPTEAFVSGSRAYYRFDQTEPRDYSVRLSESQSVMLTHDGGVNDQFFAARLKADLPAAVAKSSSPDAVFLLDTSWSDRPAAFARRLELLEAILKGNRDSIKRFSVLMFNVEQRWWRQGWAVNNDAMLAEFRQVADQLALEGATDLHHALVTAIKPNWSDDDAVPPNLFLLSDGVATWGKTDLSALADPLTSVDRSNGGGALFAYHLAGDRSSKTTLQWLAETTGGAVFDIAEQAEVETVATAHQGRPWTITEILAPQSSEVLLQGSSKTVYPGQPLVLAGRGFPVGPIEILVTRDGENRSLTFDPKITIASPTAARLFGQLAVEKLEPYGDNLEEIAVAYARYFRVPGRTCSMVMLESAQDYQRFGVHVSPQEDRLVVASTSVTDSVKREELERRERRSNPQRQFIAWVESLESASRLNVSTALRLAMKRLPETAFRFDAEPLQCRSWKTDQHGGGFAEELRKESPSFETVMAEAERKLIAWGAADALKTASTLVEAKPSDVDILRSLAFRAIHWQRSDQAAPLLWRLTQARPYQPQCWLLLARAMAESGDIDGAIVCYDLVGSGKWDNRWIEARKVAAVELLHLLERVDSGAAQSHLPQYAKARLGQLRAQVSDQGLDIAVIMHWNTDRTDVDMHVTEPNGEVCYYSHNKTRSGGSLTRDITEGLGPEMYVLKKAPVGNYKVEAKYYSSDNNRTKAPTEVLVTLLENIGQDDSRNQSHRITLSHGGDMNRVLQWNRKDGNP